MEANIINFILDIEMGMARWQSDAADGSISMETAQPTTSMSSIDVERVSVGGYRTINETIS
jgi:hypothetical protein